MVDHVNGIDVADPYQPANYPDNHLAFVFVKATQGNDYLNPELDAMIATAIRGGSLPFLYHFMDTSSAASQVAWFREKAGHQVLPGRVIAIDWEALKGVWPTCALKDEVLMAFEAAYPDNKIVLYTNKDGWLNHDTTSRCGDGLWIAAPGTIGNTGVQHPATFQQYGISGNLDLDTAFFATQAALKEWATVASAPKIPAPNATYNAVWRDDVMPAPTGEATTENPVWWPENVLLKGVNVALENQALLKQILAAVTAK